MTASSGAKPRTLLLAAASVAGVLAAGAVGLGSADALLYLLPAALLLGVLVARGYPGERVLLAAIREHRRRRPVRAAALAPQARVCARVPRGGCLLGSSLAVRPPPRRLAVALS